MIYNTLTYLLKRENIYILTSGVKRHDCKDKNNFLSGTLNHLLFFSYASKKQYPLAVEAKLAAC